MKTTILILFMFAPFIIHAQKIAVDEYDKFSKSRRVETKSVALRPSGLMQGASLKYRSAGDQYFLTLAAYGWSVGTVGEADPLIFLLDNDSTVKVFPTSVQSYEIGEYGKSYTHQYSISKDQIEQLARHKAKSIRRYYSQAYSDYDLPEKNQDNVIKVSDLFLQTINK